MIEEQYSWGIIGSPNGYQYTFQGADFGLWQQWDLSGSGALALPEPSQDSIKYPLYCLQGIQKEKSRFLSLAMYCSVKQQNSHRSGTFAGSFIACKDISLNQSNNNSLVKLLWQLTKYQLHQYVNAEDFSYHSDISGTEFIKPMEVSNLEIEKQKFPFVYSSPEPQTLFIAIRSNEELKKILDLLLQSNLTRYYEKIYFSQNPITIENFKKDDDVDFYDCFHRSGCLRIITFLSDEILRTKISLKEVFHENRKLTTDFQDQLTARVEQATENLTKQYESQLNEVIKQRNKLQEENKKLQTKNSSYLTTSGNTMTSNLATRSASFMSGQSTNAGNSTFEKDTKDRLLRIETDIKQLERDLERLNAERDELQNKKDDRHRAFIMTTRVLLVLIVLVSIVMGWIFFSSSEQQESSKVQTHDRPELDASYENPSNTSPNKNKPTVTEKSSDE